MARIKGVDIPDNKRIEVSLTYIFGIGRQLSKTILNDAKIDVNKHTKDLTEEEIVRLRKAIEKYPIEGDLRRETNMSIKTKMEINCYEGVRHKKGLPVRGQSTRSNAKTRKGKGKTIANKKK